MKENVNKNFSVIIPHKNLPVLLQRCLDSIPEREDLEIIIVDDNSDANIVDFSNFPGKNRKNVKVILDKEGKGAGAARNKGIEEATGKWLLFADSDDRYTSIFNEFLDKYETSTADIILFKANVVCDESTKKITPVMNLFIDNYLNGTSCLDDLKYGAWEPWNRMIKSSLVRSSNVRFDEISSSNDKMFSIRLARYFESVEVSGMVVYDYILRPNSIIHSGKEKRFLNSFNTILAQNSIYHEIGYKRKFFMPYFFLSHYKYLNKDIFNKYWNYLKKIKANPFEGFIHYFLFHLLIKLRTSR